MRAIWETYAGWFHHRSTTELYAVPPAAIAADVVAVAGADALLAAARTHLDAGRPVEALHLTDLVLTVEPRPPGGPGAGGRGLPGRCWTPASNFWEAAWLRRSIETARGGQ